MSNNTNKKLTSYYEQLKNINANNRVSNFLAPQLGFLGKPLTLSEGVIDAVRVSHMRSGNARYNKNRPRVEPTAHMADFVYDDIILRMKEVVLRYLLSDDITLQTQTLLTRTLFEHLRTYHELLKSVTKEAKDALIATRIRVNATNATNAKLPPENLELLQKRQTELINTRKKIKINNSFTANKRKRASELRKDLSDRLSAISKRIENATVVQAQSTANMGKVFSANKNVAETRVESNDPVITREITNGKGLPEKVQAIYKSIGSAEEHVPFRTEYGDRLMKRWLVKHSFMDRLQSALYPNSTKDELRRIMTRFESIFVDKAEQDLAWDAKLRSFGGPSKYWMQMVRELYDARRMENVRKLTERGGVVKNTSNVVKNNASKKNAPKTNTAARELLRDAQETLTANLGVTAYGYFCRHPDRPGEDWVRSYHRFGRSWFCKDNHAHTQQLPFACYRDRFAPPSTSLKRSDPRLFSNAQQPVWGAPKGKLMAIIENNIYTTVLAPTDLNGTEGRYQHIRTVFKDSLKDMSPKDVFEKIKTARDLKETDLLNRIQEARGGADVDYKDIINDVLNDERLGSNAKNGQLSPITKLLANPKAPDSKQRAANIAKGEQRLRRRNMNDTRLGEVGGGLRRSGKKRYADAVMLDENFMMVDGDIVVDTKNDIGLLKEGTPEVLGIKQKTNAGKDVQPLILPLNPEATKFDAAKNVCKQMCEDFERDAASGITGLCDRYMDNVCKPLLVSGGVLQGAHFADLHARLKAKLGPNFNKLTNGGAVERVLRQPELYNIMRCLQYYLFIHIGNTGPEALRMLRQQEARMAAHNSRLQVYELATKLRLIGDAGPMDQDKFKTIIRQHLLTAKKIYKTRTQVEEEIAQLQEKLNSFKLFGRRFSRSSYLSPMLGGKQTANRKLLSPNVANKATMTLAKTGPTGFGNLRRQATRMARNAVQPKLQEAKLRAQKKNVNRPTVNVKSLSRRQLRNFRLNPFTRTGNNLATLKQLEKQLKK